MSSTPEEISDRQQARVGTVVLLAAAIMAVLIFCDRGGMLNGAMPRYWYSTRQIHLLVCAALMLIAAILLRTRLHTGPLFQNCQVMTRQDCPLCDEAISELLKHRRVLPAIELVDVDLDEELQQRWGETVPVVLLDDRVRFRGSVNPVLLQRLIDAAELRRDRAAAGEAKV